MSHIGRDPFALPSHSFDQARRLRGRIAAPVTIVTSRGSTEGDVGLTVSSLLVAEGEPPSVLILISPSTDLWEAIEESRRFVIHVLGAGDRRLADRFAGRDLGDPFVGVPTTPSAWGLVIDGAAARGYCTLTGHTEMGWSVLVCGALDRTELTDGPGHPLVHYRGEYRGLGEERSQYRGQE